MADVKNSTLRLIKNSREDLIAVVGWLQNHPDRIARSLDNDETAKRELRRLVADLFSLIEVTIEETSEEAPPHV